MWVRRWNERPSCNYLFMFKHCIEVGLASPELGMGQVGKKRSGNGCIAITAAKRTILSESATHRCLGKYKFLSRPILSLESALAFSLHLTETFNCSNREL